MRRFIEPSKIKLITSGANGQWYVYDYSLQELREIAALARSMARLGATKIYIFFNNDVNGHAPRNALMLLEMLK
jgi:uncharacterized protein YecE (DUF72 family)